MNSDNEIPPERRKEHKNSIRKLVVEKVVVSGETIAKVCSDLRLKKSTVNSILKTLRDFGRVEKSTTRGKPIKKITEEVGCYVERLIEVNRGITLDSIKYEIQTSYNLTISTRTIYSFILILSITLKRSCLLLDRVNDPDCLELRRNYASDFLTNGSLDDAKNVFVV
jgi:transposase